MFEKLFDDKIVVELTNLVQNTDKETDEYLDFMKSIILNTSGIN